MGLPPVSEEVPFRFSPNAYKPPPDDEMDFMDLPKKKKMFSSSSFYEEPNAIYPTVEEQVELCRKIADSLSNDNNKKSKGANMFFKRVKKAEKWSVETTMGTGFEGGDFYEHSRSESIATPDPSNSPYVRVSQGPTQLRLILDPRHLLDMKRLQQEGFNIVEHNAVSPEICQNLVKDLNSPCGKGAQLFAKRKKKSEDWVVDEEKVRQLLRERESGYTSSPEPPDKLVYPCVEPMLHPRVQMIKTPWATMESPISGCARAFRELHPNEVAETVIRAAESKVMTYPSPVRPVIYPVAESYGQPQNYSAPPAAPGFNPAAPMYSTVPMYTPEPQQNVKPTSSFRVGVYTADPYKPRAPRGWTGTSAGCGQFFSVRAPSAQTQQPEVQQNFQPSTQPTFQPSAQQMVQPEVQQNFHPAVQQQKRPEAQQCFRSAALQQFQPAVQQQFQPAAQQQKRPAAQQGFQPAPQQQFQPAVQQQFQPAVQQQFQPAVQQMAPPMIHQMIQPMVQPQQKRVQFEQPAQLPNYKLSCQSSIIKSYSFSNFNKSPRAWNESLSRHQSLHIKPVKPPSVLVQ